MLKSRFESYLTFLENKTVLITSHALADPDGIASAIALYFFLQQQIDDITIFLYFSKISKKSHLYLEKLKNRFPSFDPIFKEDITKLNFEVIFVVDTNKLSKVKEDFFTEEKALDDTYVIFIDHHYLEDSVFAEKEDRDAIIIENYTSTSEILVDLYKTFKISLDNPLRYLLIAGIVVDSGYLKFANQHTHKSMAFLLGDDIQYQDVLSMLKVEPHISEKIAKIKGAQRAELIRENDWLIGISHVSSFEASVANVLIKIGFDISIVVSERKEEYRVSLRARKKVCDQCNLHLGRILEELSKQIDAVGGGHDGAASIKISKQETNIRTIILEKIKEVLCNIDK
jgi:nanoRNase/pAp phosphatase (c-di-AMP/oligoRNAs hydrolase)